MPLQKTVECLTVGREYYGFKILKVYDKIYIDDYIIESCELGEPNGNFFKVMGKSFVIRKKAIIFESRLCIGSGFKEYIYNKVYEIQKAELNTELGI